MIREADKVVTGGIVSCQDSNWLLSWTINRQGQFKDQKKDEVCVWVYSLFTDVPGDYVKKPMKECTGKEITAGVAVSSGRSGGRDRRAWQRIMQSVRRP